MSIPFFDLAATYQEIKAELDSVYFEVTQKSHFILGPELEKFEHDFAAYCDSRYCVGVGNGLDALVLILRALNVGPDDEVIVPSHTFIATWLAVMAVGAKPVPVDVDESTFNIDPKLVEQAITSKTKAIIPVHLYGQPADMDSLSHLIKKRGIHIIEDAAQAHGALHNGAKTGSFGIAAAFSFYPTKNLGALGDAGAIVTNDSSLNKELRALRNYGSAIKYQHDYVGVNSRLDEIQAGILHVKLKHLDRWNQQRVEIAQYYSESLQQIKAIQIPMVLKGNMPVWHLYVIKSAQRQRIIDTFTKDSIGYLIHYPQPPHLQRACSGLQISVGSLPVAEKITGEILSLPLWPQMTLAVAKKVIESIHRSLD